MELTEQEQLKRSVKRRQERGPAEIAELLTKDETERKKREEIQNYHSRLWNERKRALRGSVARSEPSDVQSPQNEAEPTQRASLPDGWRDGHWKTLQAMAAEFCNVETGNKAESIAVLEAYERGE